MASIKDILGSISGIGGIVSRTIGGSGLTNIVDSLDNIGDVLGAGQGGFSIKDFRANMDRKGFIKSNHSQLIFSSPKSMAGFQSDTRDIIIRCDQANIPAVWFTTIDDHRRYGYGPVDNIPQVPNFDPYTVSFIADKNGQIHRYFTDWITSVTNFNSSKSMLTSNKFGALPYEASYRTSYVTDLFIKIYDEKARDISEYRLQAAFPSALQESQMSWQETDSIVRLNVTFQYRDWALVTKYKDNGNSSKITIDPGQ